MAETLVSTEPATGEQLWSGEVGDAAAEVAVARDGWPAWAAHSTAYRMECLRRFANVVRSREAQFSDLIARETGKPLWEAKTEVGAVVNKVEISTLLTTAVTSVFASHRGLPVSLAISSANLASRLRTTLAKRRSASIL